MTLKHQWFATCITSTETIYSTALANIRPDTPDSIRVKADYSAAQYVALKNTLSACQWVRAIATDSMRSNL